MKIKLQSIVYLLFFISISSTAQIIFQQDTTVALLEESPDIKAYNHFINDTDEGKSFVWRRTVISAEPTWTTGICDDQTCWGAAQDTNVVQVAPFDTSMLELHLYPANTIKGVGIYHLEVEEVGNPSNKATAVYIFTKDPVEVTGVEELDIPTIQIYPNPSKGLLSFKDEENDVERVEVYNLIGQKMAEFDLTVQKWADITDLNEGMYLIQLSGKEGRNLGTQLVTKL